MVALDRLVFSLLVTLFLYSCSTTYKDSNDPIVIRKNINKNENLNNYLKVSEKRNQDNRISFNILAEGSISTITLLDNDLWIGKLGGSIIRYNLYTKDSKQFLDDTYSIIDFSIKKILKWNNKIIALQSNRVVIIDISTEDITIKNFPNNITRATDLVIYNNNIIISTLGFGIWEYNPKNNFFNNKIKNLTYVSSIKVNNNSLYIGSMDNGLYVYNLKSNKFETRTEFPTALFSKNILNINISRDNVVLGTSKNGLLIWNRTTNKVEKFYTDENISSVYITPDKKMVLSLVGSGVIIQNQDHVNRYTINNDLFTNNVTTAILFNNSLITGNIKKGVIQQEISLNND